MSYVKLDSKANLGVLSLSNDLIATPAVPLDVDEERTGEVLRPRSPNWLAPSPLMDKTWTLESAAADLYTHTSLLWYSNTTT